MTQGRSQRVLEALQAHPLLLYEVLTLAGRGPTVLSPWMPLANETYKRRDVAGAHVARVKLDDSAETTRWNWFVYGGGRGDPWGEAPDRWAAMVAADAKLVEFGYLLADLP